MDWSAPSVPTLASFCKLNRPVQLAKHADQGRPETQFYHSRKRRMLLS